VLCLQYKTCKFVLPLSVIAQVINLLNGIWRHHLLSNKVGQNSCPLILDNNHFKFSAICVRFMYKYLALYYISFSFFNPTPFVFFKDMSCLYWLHAFFKKHKVPLHLSSQWLLKYTTDYTHFNHTNYLDIPIMTSIMTLIPQMIHITVYYIRGWQSTPSPWPQLWLPNPLWWQWKILVSVPLHRTSSNQIWPEPAP